MGFAMTFARLMFVLLLPFALAACEGPVGQQGPQGPQGPQGAEGKSGPEGKIGPMGAKGERGEKGDKGDRGDKGDPGERGEAGLRVVEAPGSATCEANEVIVSAYCFAPRGQAGAAGNPSLQFPSGDAASPLSASCAGTQTARVFCMKR